MSNERPEALLKSALEKIIYFEARSEQLCNDLVQSRVEAERLRSELSAAAEREISLRAQVAELEVRAARAHQDREELGRLNDALRRERKELIGKLIDASRLQATGEDAGAEAESDFDLASFIAELRGEVLGLREAPAQVPALMPTPALALAAAPSMARHAERFRAQGRLDVSTEQIHALAREPLVEESLFGFSVRELSAPEPRARVRAAERLRSLANPAAAPALASALNAEREAPVLVSLLEAFAPVSGAEGAAVVVPHLRSPAADVRIAALRALLKVDHTQAAPHLSAAMKDPDRTVRRRASLLALGLSSDQALRLGEEAGRDADAKVRALGALALGVAGGAQARAALTALLQDGDASVRHAASRSLGRILGTDVSGVVPLEDAQRRREIRRLSALPSHPVTAPADARAAAPVFGHTAAPASAFERAPASERAAVSAAAPVSAPASASRSVPEVASVPAPAHEGASLLARGPAPTRAAPPLSSPWAEALCAAVLAELRISIRGRTVPDMARALGAPSERVEEACALVSARGQAVRRGLKYFVA
ncbi:MAG TPA: HEAT repeat domain-containing protein [Myxococcales bacterium]|nr:HEAT repeat domain-containing protein [Myxococcales bacterium]